MIKGQAIVDFIAECIHEQDAEPGSKVMPQEGTDQDEWVMHVDRSSTNVSVGGRVVLITPKKAKLEYAIKFGFKATNNEAKHDSMIVGLHLARELGAKEVKVKSDSQLVVR